jgi:hypothetical protein
MTAQPKTLLKLGVVGAIVWTASRKLPDAPFSQRTAAQHLECAAVKFARGVVIGWAILAVLAIIGIITAALGDR